LGKYTLSISSSTSSRFLIAILLYSRASAYTFAQRNAKAIYVTDLNDSNLVALAEDITKTTGVDCIAKQVDAADDDDIQDVINDALEKYGRLDVFFANAGVAGPHPMATENKDAFLKMMHINTWR
jgi:NADP-dependent 3-hydroxy acid dehydrogenase YdfG